MPGAEMRLLRSAACLYALVILAVFAQSYQGRVQVVKTQRRGCQRQAQRNVSTINRDSTTVKKDDAFVSDSRLSRGEREGALEEGLSAARESQVLISQLDTSQIEHLASAQDRSAARRAHFSCNGAYPSASPWPTF